MSVNFTPNFRPTSDPVTAPASIRRDVIARTLVLVASGAMIMLGFLVPIFFIPIVGTQLGMYKVILAGSLTLVALLLVTLRLLRLREGSTVLPLPTLMWLAVVMVALTSALLSGDRQDALFGVVFEIHTVTFLALMGAVMTAMLVFQRAHTMARTLLWSIGGGVMILFLFHVSRFIFGPTFLSFGAFGEPTASPIGAFNDVAVVGGITLIISMIILTARKLTLLHTALTLLFVVLATIILAVINFSLIWILVGFFALALFLFLLMRDVSFAQSGTQLSSARHTLIPLIVVGIVCLIAGTFLVAGESIGSLITRTTGISYIEVRPSATATFDIMRSAYSENLLLGAGPNRFTDLWRLYKNPEIVTTIFWDTDFTAGSSYALTLLIGTGVLGAVALLAFLYALAHTGYRLLLQPTIDDPFWYFFATVSFSATVYFLIVLALYVPGPVVLLYFAIAVGALTAAVATLSPTSIVRVPLVRDRRSAFPVLVGALMVIVCFATTAYFVGRQFTSHLNAAYALQATDVVQAFDYLGQADIQYRTDETLIQASQVALAQAESILVLPTPNDEEQAALRIAVERALLAATAATAHDPTNARTHATLARVYGLMAIAGVPGARDRAEAALEAATLRDPQNPTYDLVRASIARQVGDPEAARNAAREALQKKSNFTLPLALLTQLDIEEGNTKEAILNTEAILQLEPQNPTRYYQLGVLRSADGNQDGALAAYDAALSLDQSFANARYLRALVHYEQGDTEQALRDLRIVAETNPNNQDLQSIISAIESGTTLTPPSATTTSVVSEVTPVTDENGAVVSDSVPDSDVVTPVNQVPDAAPDEAVSE